MWSRLVPRLLPFLWSQGQTGSALGRCRLFNSLTLSDARVQKYIESFDQSKGNPELASIVNLIKTKNTELLELEVMSKENQEFREIARSDSEKIELVLKELEEKFFEAVLPPDEWAGTTNVIIEISAGVGGQEAMLFTQELYQMYESYAEFKGWDWVPLASSPTELGGLRNATASISGDSVYTNLKYEGGVHRVQRIPKTERTGRIHTSTSTVAILPSPSEIQIQINPADLKIETKRATGAGGQHVNTTESAVRVTHLPTRISVDSQCHRSQIQNRSAALQILRARLYEKLLGDQTKKLEQSRKLQVGFGGRNEKIRTYNYNQDRLTDHRIGLTLFNLNSIMSGGTGFDGVVEKLVDYDKYERVLEGLRS